MATEAGHSRVLVWLTELETEIGKPLLKLLGQPRARGKASNKEYVLPMFNQERCSKIPEYTDRICGKASPEVISDGVHGRLNRGFEELRNLCAVYKKVWTQV